MRKNFIIVISKILAVTLVLFVLIVCWKHINIFEKVLEINEFSALKVNGQIDVYLTKGEHNYVVITTGVRYRDSVSVEINQDTLTINSSTDISWERVLEAHIFYNSPLDYISVEGAGKLHIDGNQLKRKLSVKASGARDVYIKGRFDSLDVEQHLASDVFLSGVTNVANYFIDGVGDLVAYNMDARNVLVEMKSRSRSEGIARLSVSDSLQVLIQGDRFIYIKGDPVIAQQIEGNGKVIRK